MNMLAEFPMPVMKRHTWPRGDADGPEAAYSLLDIGRQEGIGSALITVVDIIGGAPRALGSHMAVLADGRYCGYISGGCVESSVAAEAIRVIAAGRDEVLRFGVNSRFVDIKLPCGGGIDLHIHVNPAPELVEAAVARISARQPFEVVLDPDNSRSSFSPEPAGNAETRWRGTLFHRYYTPDTQLLLVGRGLEFEILTRLARAALLSVQAISPDDYSLTVAQNHGATTTRLVSLSSVPELPIDKWTAVIFLFHDHDWETALLIKTLKAEPFFLGALGSVRAHTVRCDRLRKAGVTEQDIARIRGPIGLFGPTRESTSLSLSVLAQITSERLAFDARK